MYVISTILHLRFRLKSVLNGLLSTNRRFLNLIERSRSRLRSEGEFLATKCIDASNNPATLTHAELQAPPTTTICRAKPALRPGLILPYLRRRAVAVGDQVIQAIKGTLGRRSLHVDLKVTQQRASFQQRVAIQATKPA